MVAVRRHGRFPAQALLVASIEGTAEVSYLGSHIIYVVFSFRSIACGSENIGQSAAQDCTATMTYVKRSSGIDTNKLQLDGRSLAQLNIPVHLTGSQN